MPLQKTEQNRHMRNCFTTFQNAERERERERERETEDLLDFHRSKGIGVHRTSKNQYYGFPISIGRGNWCTQLKVLSRIIQRISRNGNRNVVQNSQGRSNAFSDRLSEIDYIGIASDEPLRIERYKDRQNVILPLVDIGWTEAECRKWCEENDLLSPIYTTSARGGCWFCHNQGIEQMRLLRKNYPDLWALLMKWDLDSPVTFKADGHTVHDYDERFALEELDIVPKDRTFRWKMIDEYKACPYEQISLDDF